MLLSDKQKEFIEKGHCRWNFKVGATGTGKTYLDFIYLIPKRIIERKGKEGLNALIGVTQQTIERNVLEPMRNYWGSDLIGEIRKGTNKVTLFGEEAYVFGAEKVSGVAKLRGSTIKYCYGDEVVDWNEEVFQMIKSRLRTECSCFDGTGNPQYPSHWLKKFLDSDVDIYHQKYKLDDNPFLPENIKKELRKEYTGTVYYNRYILGEWCNAEGLLFPQYANNTSQWEVDKLPPFCMVNLGLDIGGTKSHSPIVATGIKVGYTGVCSFMEDRVKHEKGTVDVNKICNLVLRMLRTMYRLGYVVSYVFVDNAEQVILNSIYSAVAAAGYEAVVTDCKKVKGSTRILTYNLMLNTNRMEFKNVPMITESLSTALYDEKQKEDSILDDFTTDIDTFDAHFYSWSYFMDYIVLEGGM